MSKRYYCSDLHLGHSNIVKYCDRPYLRKGDLDENHNWTSAQAALDCAERMNAALIRNFNSRVKAGDVVVCAGDFINYGSARGVVGLKLKSQEYLKQLNGTWVLVTGNHDGNNHCKTVAKYMITDIGPYRVLVCHHPTDNEIHDQELIDWAHKHCAFAVVGHVHNKWKTDWKQRSYLPPLLNINVSVEVCRYIPIDDSEIIGIYEKSKRELKH